MKRDNRPTKKTAALANATVADVAAKIARESNEMTEVVIGCYFKRKLHEIQTAATMLADYAGLYIIHTNTFWNRGKPTSDRVIEQMGQRIFEALRALDKINNVAKDVFAAMESERALMATSKGAEG